MVYFNISYKKYRSCHITNKGVLLGKLGLKGGRALRQSLRQKFIDRHLFNVLKTMHFLALVT